MGKLNGQLDHVVLLIPYDTLKNPPSWITDNFTLSPGGKHGDNKTENRLVLFSDGTYLELISFIDDDPEKRKGHWWDKPFGVVDFSLTSADKLDYEGLVDRLDKSGTGVSFAQPKQGGRVTNGNEIKWEVTFPTSVPRGHVPFFCEDVTDRSLRVPIDKENTSHPCKALGMAGITAAIQKDKLENLSLATAAILDEQEENGRYRLAAPVSLSKLMPPVIRLEEMASASGGDIELTLTLQTYGDSPRSPIRERIGDGVVRIEFERCSI